MKLFQQHSNRSPGFKAIPVLPQVFGVLACCLPGACGGGTSGPSYGAPSGDAATTSTTTGAATSGGSGVGGAGAAGAGVTSSGANTTTAAANASGNTSATSASATASTNGVGGAANVTSGDAAASTTGSTTVSGCGMQITLDPNPFGCELAWGANGDRNNRSSYLQFITTWVGYEQNGGLNGDCDGCGLVGSLANGNAIPVYYAYHIGYMTSEDGYGDCNLDFDGQNLCTHGAQWIRENRDRLIDAYGNYAEMTYQANTQKSVVWLLEGDFIQYTYEEQTQRFSVEELAQLATDIICAIRSNAPNAVIAINHSPWISNELANDYYAALPMDLIDMIWTTGVGNNDGFINSTGSPSEYNGATARYDYLNELTGKRILVDTSFGASQMNDSWSGESQNELNARIAEGVSAVNVTEPPGDYQSRIDGMQLSSTCQ